MLRVNQVKVPVSHTEEQLKKKTAEMLRVIPADIRELKIIRQSIDARRKPDIFYSYSVDVSVRGEEKILRRFANKSSQVSRTEEEKYVFPKPGNRKREGAVVIAGMGPAGLFCAYFLALHGYRPIVLERGRRVEERIADVEKFWETGVLNPVSNVQFGEGGAGTFSDGKLNTLVKDKGGRNRVVLETFVRFGAKPEICYEAKPHIGTDVLSGVVRNMREEIIRLGGEVRFESCVTGLSVEKGRIKGVVINNMEKLPCAQLVLAIGHSARDTFSMLYEKKLSMEAKAFAVGFRVAHPQSMINISQYGRERFEGLGAAPYKVAAQAENGRSVYSFCMCPGGYVVNASSEEGRTAVNGMSYSGRDGKNANSAIIVSVTPKDFGSEHPLAGIEFQRKLEEKAYQAGGGKIPVQRYGDFREIVSGNRRDSRSGQETEQTTGKVQENRWIEQEVAENTEKLQPQCKGEYAWADLSGILSQECNQAFVDGMTSFGHQIKGFDREDAILLGVESRTSSPVRILRDGASLQADIEGIYPCGEGAGYAGGITSAAMDGIRVAESIAAEFSPEQVVLTDSAK